MINVVCVKTGAKYEPEFVNRLYRMVRKNLSLPFDFYCLTEIPDGLHDRIITVDISDEVESGIDGFWPKLCIFNPELYRETGPTLYLDLDVVIQNNISYLFSDVNPQKIKICYNGNDSQFMEWDIERQMYYFTEVNSSIMIFNSDELYEIYEHFEKNPYIIIDEYKGVCRYLWNVHRDNLEYLEILKDYYHVVNIPGILLYSSWQDASHKLNIKSVDRNASYDGYYLSEATIAVFNGPGKDIFADPDNIFSRYYK